MPRIRRKLPRIFAALLFALSIACLPAPLVRVARAAGQASPLPAQKSALDAPARELARRIAASLPGGTRVEIEVRNQSSLSEDEAAAIRAALGGELSARGLRTRDEGPGAASVVVTLSENVQSLVWVAQIQHGDDSAVLLQSVPRETPAATPPESEKIVLHKELLWSGPAHVLDAIEVPASGGTPARLLLLELEGTTAVVTDSQNTFRTVFPVVISSPRDARGRFVNGNTDIEVALFETRKEWNDCKVALDPHAAPQCERVDLVLPIKSVSLSLSGDQGALSSLRCGVGDVALGTGTGDYTQTDTVVAYARAWPGPGEALSAALTLPGPVIELSGKPDGSTIAVARDLQTGNYEVYRITATCGQ
jgi:hypothetical protein